MPFFSRTEEEIVQDSLDKLRQNSNITQLSAGSKTRFVIETVSSEQADQNDLFDQNLIQAFIRYAEGRFLDYFGDMLNVPRYEAQHAFSVGDNFFFYVDNGSFGDINNGESFTIPANTVIKTVQLEEQPITPGIRDQQVISFATTESVLCEASASFVFVPLRSFSEGLESTVARNTLTVHNFNGYALAANKKLKCANKYAIDNGTNRETDISYRYRLQNAFKSKAFATNAAIRLAALAIPGVADVEIVNAEQGPGTYALYIDGIAPTVSPDLVSRVSESVQRVSAEGIRAFISGARNLGLELVVAIHWSPNISKQNIEMTYVNIRRYIEDQLESLRMGEKISLTDLIDGIRSVSPYIITIGRNKPNTLEQVFIYKTSPQGIGEIRTLHIGEEIEPLYNEKIILETGNRYKGIQFISF